MAELRLGSNGPDVRRLEERLCELSLYTGSIDGIFGGGVESAVKSFQKSKGLDPDGVAGVDTWAALFPGEGSPAAGLSILAQPLAQRCLALTGTFETSTPPPDCFCGITGDSDGQGMSFGALQWNFGQKTLQPMLAEMLSLHGGVMAGIFHDQLDALKDMLAGSRASQLAWARSIQNPIRFTVSEPWRGMFCAMGRTAEYQAVETKYAAAIHDSAVAMCGRYEVTSQRALALMFDIAVQNGSIDGDTEAKIRADFAANPGMDEVGKLQAVANRRAEASRPKYVEDVRTRKLTIANGKGKVHGLNYDLEREFGIGLGDFA